jgi:hypothetical protein
MTICIAWIRKIGKTEELVFASDSRLRSYGAWDANPKIFPLERTDCAICFAGDTQFSYPIMTQIQFAIKSFKMCQSRFQDIVHFQGHLVNMINYMLKFKTDFEIPKVTFLFGGYSWDRGKFIIWQIYFDKHISEFVSSQVKKWKGIDSERQIMYIGNYLPEFTTKLKTLLVLKNKLVKGDFDMEPFEVLVNMLREKSDDDDIGGPPQLLKVYKHLNRAPFAVKWRISNKNFVSLLGRPLQDYELTSYPIIDPDTMEVVKGTNWG